MGHVVLRSDHNRWTLTLRLGITSIRATYQVVYAAPRIKGVRDLVETMDRKVRTTSFSSVMLLTYPPKDRTRDKSHNRTIHVPGSTNVTKGTEVNSHRPGILQRPDQVPAQLARGLGRPQQGKVWLDEAGL